MSPQPPDPFAELLAERLLRPVVGAYRSERARDQGDHRGSHEEGAGIDEERGRERRQQEDRADRRSGERVGDVLDAPDPPVRLLELVGLDDVGDDRLVGVVAQHLGRAEQQGRGQHDEVQAEPRVDHLIELVGARQHVLLAEHREGDAEGEQAAHDVHRDHRSAPVDPVGDHPRRQREHEPGEPLGDRDQRHEDRVASDRRREPGVGDESDPVTEVGHRGADQQLVVAPGQSFRRDRRIVGAGSRAAVG